MFRRLFRRKPRGPEYLERGYSAHRRDVWRRLLIPGIGVGVLIVLIPLLLLALGGASRLGVAAALMTVCAVLPAIIMLLVVYAALVAATFGAAKAYSKTSGALKGVHGVVHKVNVATTTLSQRVTAPLIAISARLAYLTRAVGLQPPSAKPDEEKQK